MGASVFRNPYLMRNTLITIAAWTTAIAIVLWQRFIWPGLKSFLPGIEELFSAPASEQAPEPVRTASVQEPVQPIETLVIERCQPASPRRTTRKNPTAAGFAL
jgi:hypothetical protein